MFYWIAYVANSHENINSLSDWQKLPRNLYQILTTIWTVQQKTSHRSTASIQAVSHSGFDGHHELLPSDWLIGFMH